MKNKNKVLGIITCAIGAIGATAFGFEVMPTVSTSADTTTVTFEMSKKAGVRYGEDIGIRFMATVSKEYLDTLGDTVILKSSIDKANNKDEGEAKVKEWVLKGENAVYNATDAQGNPYPTNTFYHAILFSDLTEGEALQAAAVDLTATMWLENGEGELLTEKQSTTRSMRWVANAAYEDAGDNQSKLDAYLGERTFAEETLYTDATETELATGTELANEYNYAYIGAQAVGTVENGVVTFDREKLANVTDYGKTTLTLFDANNNAYSVPLVYATKLLNDAEDFNVFDLSTEKVVEGYYCLTDNVSLPTAFSHEAYWEKEAGKLTFNTAIGFNGVFEGNGYTVSYSFNEWGLFGNILEGATVQNVKFVATRNAEESGVLTANGALARSVVGGEIKNVYANITDELSDPKRNASFIGSREYNTATRKYVVLTNVIVESNDTNSALRGGVLFDADLARMQKADMLDRNVYVISENTFIANWNPDMTTDFCYANNDSGSYTQNSSKIVQYSYVNRYDSYEAMTTAQATDKNDFTSFDETYWDKSSGVPVWKQKGVIITVQDYAKTVVFSVADGTLPLADIFGKEVTITKALQGDTELTVANNVITGLTVNDNDVTETTLTVYSDSAAYNVNIKAYTKVLTEAEDLGVFALSTTNPYFVNGVIKGSFFLADNITSTVDEMVHTAYWTNVATNKYATNYASIGFAGLLEGNGKTLSYVCRETGLLGNVLEGARIQNIQLVATRNTVTLASGIIQGALASYSHGGTLENVYAKIVDNTTTRARNISLIGYRMYTKGAINATKLTNVIVESINSVNATRGGVLFDSDGARGDKSFNVNVYAISTNVNMANWAAGNTTNRCYANNDSATITTGTKYATVNRYDDVATMAGSVTKVGDWAVSASGISWAK